MANKRPSAENVENFYANVDQNLGWCLIPKVNNIQGVWSFTRKKIRNMTYEFLRFLKKYHR